MKKLGWALLIICLSASLLWAASDTDNFNRTDSSPLDGSWSFGYFPADGNPQLISNVVYPSYASPGLFSNIAVTTSFSPSANQYSQVEIAVFTGTSSMVGVVLRGTPATDVDVDTGAYYFCGAFNSGYTLIATSIANFWTALIDSSESWSVGDILYCEVDGDVLTMKKNGVTVLTTGPDATFASGDLGIVLSTEVSVFDVALDNWEGGDLVVTPPVTVRRRAVIVQ